MAPGGITKYPNPEAEAAVDKLEAQNEAERAASAVEAQRNATDKVIERIVPRDGFVNNLKEAQVRLKPMQSASRAAAQRVKVAVDALAAVDAEHEQVEADVRGWEQEAGRLEASIRVARNEAGAEQNLSELREKINAVENPNQCRRLQATRDGLVKEIEEAVIAYWPVARVALSARQNVAVLEVNELREQVSDLTARLTASEARLRGLSHEGFALGVGHGDRDHAPSAGTQEIGQCKIVALKEAEGSD